MLSTLNKMMPSKIEIALQDMLDGKQIDSKFIMAEFSRLKLKIDQQEQEMKLITYFKNQINQLEKEILSLNENGGGTRTGTGTN